MKRGHRDNKPRFHKHRQGKMLLPHKELSGLFLTINPRQEARAQREAQLYFSSLTRDLEAARDVFEAGNNYPIDAVAPHEKEPLGHDTTTGSSSDAPHGLTAVSSLLAAELAAASGTASNGCSYAGVAAPLKRSRREGQHEGDGKGILSEDNDSDSADPESSKHQNERRRGQGSRHGDWFAPLETGCKGYLFLNVPTVNPKVTCTLCHAAPANITATAAVVPDVSESPSAELEKGESNDTIDGDLPSAKATAMPPHTIVINPLISRITERIFDDLAANPRPIFRNCFRLMPAELTCCPTLPEMQAALRQLLAVHFPKPTATPVEAIRFDEAISYPTWGSDIAQRSMHTISLQFLVKNNSNVEQKKASIAAALQAAIPANRFIVVSQPSLKTKCVVEATLCIFVAHATCVMGVQRRVTERRGFNLHAVGGDAFVLANNVKKDALTVEGEN